MQPTSVPTNLLNQPSSCYTIPEPLGVVCIIAAWNFPFQLLFTPLIGAIAAGNCAVLKPSEFAGATAAIMGKMIKQLFPENYMLYLEGDGAEVLPPLFENFRFDHIFFTGSPQVGRLVSLKAADQLIPVTLELGGKSPCIVDDSAKIKVAAKRIISGKFINVGQTCIAPDYLIVHEKVKPKLIEEMTKAIGQYVSDVKSMDFPNSGEQY